MDIPHFGLYAVAVLLLNITPGNDFIYVATRALSSGTRGGIISAFGITAGLLIHFLASIFGLSLIVAKSVGVYTIIKYIGAGYLIYLGVKIFFSKPLNPMEISGATARKNSAWIIFRQGFLTNTFNPKVALFFLSFLPQFADSHAANYTLQLAGLSVWFIFSGTIVNIAIALLFGRLRIRMKKFSLFWKWQSKITGTILVMLGLKIALSQKR